MKTRFTILTTTLILSITCFASLSGTYIIKDDGTGDFLTLQGAINYAETTGLSGATTFEIHNPLTGLTVINAIPGTSSNKKLTITALPNYIVETLFCDGVSWLVLEDITFLETLYIDDSKRVVVRGCTFFGSSGINAYNDGVSKFITISDNDFLNISGSTTGGAIFFQNGPNGQTRNVVVKNNFITGQYNSGMDFHSGIRDITVSDNVVTIDSPTAILVDLGDCEGVVNIRRNQFISLPNDPTNISQGLHVSGSNNTKITNNFFSTSGTGISVFGSGQFIANNSIRSTHHMGVKIYSDNVVFKNNAIYSSESCLYYDANNLNSDYNAYKSDGINEFVYLGAYFSALSTLQATHNTDQNSMLADPQFVSDTDLHLQSTSPIIGDGISLAQVTKDIDNGLRGSTVDIGADEFGVSKSAGNNETALVGVSHLNLLVYPNPSNGQFRVKGDFDQSASYVILDLQGRIINQGFIGKGVVDITGAAQGQYLLQLTDGNRIENATIIIE